MQPDRHTAVGAAALFAVAGIAGLATAAPANAAQPAKVDRITSAQQLRASIQQAAVLAKQQNVALACCPGGQANAGVHSYTPTCTAGLAYREAREA